MAHQDRIKDKNARCKLCGKTLMELEAEGYEFHDPIMTCVGGDYQNVICPACLDVIDDRFVTLLMEKNGALDEVLRDVLPKLLFEMAINLQARRNGCSVDDAFKSLCKG